MSSKGYFDQVAGQWDDMREAFFSSGVRDKAIAAAQVQPGQLAADLGAGTGFVSEALVKAGLRVIAVDQSDEMLATMRERFAGIDNIEYRAGDAADLPIADGTVDYVFANMFLHHVESPRDTLREIARILRLGGKVVITDVDKHNHEFLLVEHHDRWPGFERNDIQQWYETAGLTAVSISDAEEKCSSTSTQGDDQANINIFIAYGEKQ